MPLRSLRLELTDMQPLRWDGQLSQLRSLALAIELEEGDLEQIGRIRSLRHLELRGEGLTSGGVAHLRPLTALRTLSLEGRNIGKLIPMSAFPELEELKLSWGATSLRDLGSLEKLRGLDLYGRFGDRDLAGLGSLLHLTTVSIEGAFTDRSMRGWGNVTQLEELSLRSRAMTDASLRTVGKLAQLERLTLGRSRLITGAGFAHLADLQQLQKLHVLPFRLLRGAMKHEGFSPQSGLDRRALRHGQPFPVARHSPVAQVGR